MRLFITGLMILISSSIWSQDFNSKIKTFAEEYNQTLIDHDYERIVALTDEDVVMKGGGVKLMVDVEKQKHEFMTASGISIISISPDALISTAINGNEVQAVLSQEIILSVADSKFKKTGYYFVRSKDRGETWRILDLEPFTDDSIKEFIPTISPDITIPEPVQGEIIKDK